MSQIQDEAYTEACEEIERLKFLNIKERKTIKELAALCARAADALEWSRQQHPASVNADLIAELRNAAK